jgi:hypothetical protein
VQRKRIGRRLFSVADRRFFGSVSCFTGKTGFASIGYHLSQSPLIEAQGALSMDYTRLRKRLRNFAYAQNGSYWELTGANRTVNLANQERTRKTKTPSITMGFCILGGYIPAFEVRLQRAVMPCD